MLKLQNVSKYYHSNDVVALGLRKVNLEFKLGEFVAVTGESGSGKSTLLNVLSGLDTYEDGELYVNGEETSYYSIEEWEGYRRQYIGFVFQNYNIIDSYSVLENVMVALTIQGYPKDEIKDRALELIDQVGLSSHVHHKASKLSGGQKQRAVIARALAKDCPIIVCDEPTGNLDSESSRIIMELLQKISKDKLVIVVTHNYDEVAEFATRKIRLFDGAVVEDKHIKSRNDVVESVQLANYHMTTKNLLGISLKNLFRTPRRTIFSTIIMIFIAIIFTFSYGSYVKNANSLTSFGGWGIFENVNERRVIVTKYDLSPFTVEELTELRNNSRVNYLMEHDVVLDSSILFYETRYGDTWDRDMLLNPAEMLDAGNDLKSGRLPEEKYEVVVEEDIAEVGDIIQLGVDYTEWDGNKSVIPDSAEEFEVVGVVKNIFPTDWKSRIYVHEDYLNQDIIVERAYNTGRYQGPFIKTSVTLDQETLLDNVIETVNDGMYYGEDYDRYYYENENYFWDVEFIIDNTLNDNEIRLHEGRVNEFIYQLDIDVEENPEFYKDLDFHLNYYSAFFENQADVKIVGYVTAVEGKSTYEVIELNQATYDSIMDNNIYQISMLVNGTYQAEALMDELDDNYNTIYPSSITDEYSRIIQFFSNIGFGFQVVFLMVIIYFVSYFVLRNVQNAKKKDYLIYRSIGASQKDLSKVTLYELLITVTMGYIITIALLQINELFNSFIPQYMEFFTVWSYIFIFVLLAVLALLLGRRFNNKIFSNSVITSLKQE